MADYVKMQEIASFLGKDDEADGFKKLSEIVMHGELYLTFWGQFSAGKSKLINNIVGRDILPVKRTETTAVLTYIRYGDNEGCRIRYSDGRTEDKDLTYALSVTQQGAGELARHIDYMELTVNEPLLSGNIVFVDTPGINTLHERHQQLAEEAVRQSGKLVYVLSGNLSKVDKESIESIVAAGVDIIFVRTHCDDFNATEENIDESLKKEHEELRDIVGRKVEFFPVSNLKDNPWFDKISDLRRHFENIATNLEAERNASIEMRCDIVGAKYVSELSNRVLQINELLTGNSIKLQNEINECQEKVDRLRNVAEKRDNILRNQLMDVEREVKNDVLRVCEQSKKRFENLLNKESDTQAFAEELPKIYNKEIRKSLIKMQQVMDEKLGLVIISACEGIYVDIDSLDRPEPPMYEEIQRENMALLDQSRAKLMSVRKKIEDLEKERQEACFDVQNIKPNNESEYAEAIRQIDEALNKIPTDTPTRICDNDSPKVSDIFRNIGKVADLALLLIPGEAIVGAVKGAANATKIAQGLNKMGKAGQVILGAAGVAAKNATWIDRGRDCLYGISKVFGMRNYSTAKNRQMAADLVDKVAGAAGNAFDKAKANKNSGKPGFFDYISAEYWFGKFGGMFDCPPKMEIDKDEEEYRNQLRRDLTEKKQLLIDEKIEKMRRAGIIKDKEKELVIRQQEQENIKAEIEKELKRRGQELRDKSIKDAVVSYKKNYIEYFSNILDKLSNKFIQEYLKRASTDIDLYVERENLTVIRALESKKEHLNDLLKAKANGDDELKEQLSTCKKYIDLLQEA